jgi:hypothetical protein
MTRIGSESPSHFSQKTREMGHLVLQSSTDAMPVMHARSLAPLVKNAGLRDDAGADETVFAKRAGSPSLAVMDSSRRYNSELFP